MTLIVALIGMLGSTITVVIGDSLQDQRRVQAETQMAYRDFLAAARQYEDTSIRKETEALKEELSAIKAYRRDPSGSNYQLTTAYSDQKTAFEGIWTAWGTLIDKYEDIRLMGSPASINCAGDVTDVALKSWDYMVHISNLMVGDANRVKVTRELTDFETTQFKNEPTAKPFWDTYNSCRTILESKR